MSRAGDRLLLHCGVAVAWGLVVSIGAYAAVRAVQAVVVPDPDPAALSFGVHAGFFWRIWTVAYAGAIAAFIVFLVARRDPGPLVRALGPAVAVVAAALALQAAFFP